MNRRLQNGELFMMLSNIFLVLPVIFAVLYHQWLYCFFASGIFIFSPLFHWYRILKPSSIYFSIFKLADWLFATSAFLYMYYYVYRYAPASTQTILYIALTLVVIFFWYGWRRGAYNKLHPWFHIIAPIVSSAILVASN